MESNINDYFIYYDKKEQANEISSFNEENSFNEILYETYIDAITKDIENKTYTIKPTFFEKISKILQLELSKIKSICKVTLISPMELYYLMKYESFHKISHDEDKCTICLDSLYDITKENTLIDALKLNNDLSLECNVIMLENCSDHFFHIQCVFNMIGVNSFIKCPVCTKIYGILIGTQPQEGEMTAMIDYNMKCKGYEKFHTIIIEYYFPDGKGYTGTHRTAFLPNNEEGKKILGLLKVCFDRRLVFTVGTSVTSGRTNTTVWAGIHHKTNLCGGPTQFGYPDATYFNRVREEMAAKGVTEGSLSEKAEVIGDKLILKSKSYYK